MRQCHVAWSKDEIDTLIELRREGASTRDIADVLGRSFFAVEGKMASVRSLLWKGDEKQPERVPLFVHSNLTARIAGDPPPGRSALDQRGRG